MQMKQMLGSTLILSVVCLSGCAKLGFKDHTIDYTKAESTVNVIVPTNAPMIKSEPMYLVPTAPRGPVGKEVPMVPPGSRSAQVQLPAPQM